MTSGDLTELKILLIASSNAFEETTALVDSAQSATDALSRKLTRNQKSIFWFLMKKKILRLQHELQDSEERLAELREQRDLTVVQLDIDTEDVFFQLYQLVGKSFQLLKSCEKKWDMTSSKATNRIAERTSATSTIARSAVDLSERALPILRTKDTCFCIHNINGGDLYFYPGFMIVYDTKTDFALIDYADLNITYTAQRFIESETVPKDTVTVGQTWYKVNKDGSPDRRFASNYQIPIVQYGEIHLTSTTGLSEAYCFSNAESAQLFTKAVHDYADALKGSKALLNQFR